MQLAYISTRKSRLGSNKQPILGTIPWEERPRTRGPHLPPPNQPGRYAAALKITGTSLNGMAYSRMASAEFRVLPAMARFVSIADSAIDDNGDGMPERVIVEANLEVTQPGNYEFAFNLRNGEQVLTTRVPFRLEAGRRRIEAPIGLADLTSLGSDGPYAITDAFLFLIEMPDPLPADHVPDAGLSGVYPVSRLQTVKPITASAAALAFGDVETGTEKVLNLTLTNSGSFPFTEAIATVSNSLFRVTTPLTVPAKGTLAVPVRFLPTAAGARTATMTLAGVTISLTGSGVVTAANPAPVVSSLSPATASAGSAAFTLTLTGAGFIRGSEVRWNGAARTTTFAGATSLTAAIPASDLAAAATAQVTVFNPAPAGGTSAGRAFTVTAVNAAVAAIETTPSTLLFGDVPTNQNKVDPDLAGNFPIRAVIEVP